VLVQLGRRGGEANSPGSSAPVGEMDQVSSEFYGGHLFGADDRRAASGAAAVVISEPTEPFETSANTHTSATSSDATNASSFRDSLVQSSLDVDEDSLAQMIAMGFEAPWAALALRRCNNNLEESIFFCSENEEMKRSLLMEEEMMRRIRHEPRDSTRQQSSQDKKKPGFGSAMKNMFGLGGRKQTTTTPAAAAVIDLHADSSHDATQPTDSACDSLPSQTSPPASYEPMSLDPAPSYDEVVDGNTYTKFNYSHENTGPELMAGVSLQRSIDVRNLAVDAPPREVSPAESSVPYTAPAESAPVIEERLEADPSEEHVVALADNVRSEQVPAPQNLLAETSQGVFLDQPPDFDSGSHPLQPTEVTSRHDEITNHALEQEQMALAVSATSVSTAELLGSSDVVVGSPPTVDFVAEEAPLEKLNVAVLVGQAVPQASIVQSSSDFEFSVTSTGVVVSDVTKRASVGGGSNDSVPLVDAMLPMSISHMPREVARAYGFDGKQFYMTVAAPLLLKDEAKIEEARKKEMQEKEMERRRLQNRSFLRATSDYFYGIEDVTGASKKTDKEEIPRRKQLKASVVAEKLPNGAGSVITGAAITLKQPQLPPHKKSPQGDRPGMVVLKLPADIRAVKLCESMAPPVWSGDGDVMKCVSCKVSPGVFNPLHHCRNCGYFVCEDCSDKIWPSSMLPDTFHNNESVVRVCDSCHILMELFADALRRGDVKAAFAIFHTGNVNLRRPFLIYKSRDYPIHSAVRGGSLVLLRWLLETECCPCRDTKNEPIVTSSGQCLLSLAAYYGHVDMMRYLVQRQNFSLLSITDIDVLRRGLHSALGVSPCSGLI
jgi:hypothetical protein